MTCKQFLFEYHCKSTNKNPEEGSRNEKANNFFTKVSKLLLGIHFFQRDPVDILHGFHFMS